jgi:hypothetical protein
MEKKSCCRLIDTPLTLLSERDSSFISMAMEATASDMPSKLRCGPKLAMKLSQWIREASEIAVVREDFMRILTETYIFSYSKLFNNSR